MKRLLVLLIFIGVTITARAADVPTVIQGTEEYDEAMCVNQYANDCISTICLTSEDRDCQEKCQLEAEDKCREQMQ